MTDLRKLALIATMGKRDVPRHLLVALCFAAIQFSVTQRTWAAGQSYPIKPIRLIVASSPGGPNDLIARIVAVPWGDALGRPLVVDNRAGAAGMIGTEIVARAAPDGYTLLLGFPGPLIIGPLLSEAPAYEALKDFAPVALAVSAPFVLLVNPHLPAKTVAELVALARAKPGQMSFATSGIGSTNHLTGVVFQTLEKIKINFVPYKGGGPAVTDLLGGHVDTMFATMPSVVPFVKSGKLKALVVTDNKRWAALPDVPSAKEAGVASLIVITWNGVLAPAGLPDAVVARLNADIVTVANTADTKERMKAQAAEVTTTTPGEFATMLRNDFAKWSKVIKDAGMRAE